MPSATMSHAYTQADVSTAFDCVSLNRNSWESVAATRMRLSMVRIGVICLLVVWSLHELEVHPTWIPHLVH